MAKTSGLGTHFYVDGYDLSGDTNALDTIESSIEMLDDTGINKYAHERLPGLKDGKLGFTVIFNPSTSSPVAEHSVLNTPPRADRILLFCANSIGDMSAAMVAKQTNYAGNRDDKGNLKFKVEADANGFGLEWPLLLTPNQRTDTAATNGTAFDFGAATSFGFQAYLQLIAFTGTDATVKLQDSADNSTFADVASGAFVQVTSTTPQAQRIAVGGTATVRRYVRVSTVTTGGFTSLTFVVSLVKNPAAVAF